MIGNAWGNMMRNSTIMQRILWTIGMVVLSLAPLHTVYAQSLDPPPLVSQQTGKYIYDESSHLTAGQIADLQQRAGNLVQAGAAPIVYLQNYAATSDETRQNAQSLVNAWHLGANWVVIFINFDPTNPKHGSAIVSAGPNYNTSGVLDDADDQAIYDQNMVPHFQQGDFAGGIAAGLDAAYARITAPPPASGGTGGSQATASAAPAPDYGSILAFLLFAGLLGWSLFLWLRAHRSLAYDYPLYHPGTMPDDVAAPLVGVLLHETAQDQDVRAAILDMAVAGAVAIEPISDRAIQIRLQDKSLLTESWQLLIYESLATQADHTQVVSASGLEKASKTWQPIYDVIGAELRQHGLAQIDDTPPPEPTTHAQINEIIAIGLGAVFILFGLGAIKLPVLMNVWFGLFVGGLAVALWGIGDLLHQRFVSAERARLPAHLTPLGQMACAAWMDYTQRIETMHIHQTDPTRLTIYAPVLQVTQTVLPWLITTARLGFIPAWLSEGMARKTTHKLELSSFYVYWLAFLQGAVDPELIVPAPDIHQSVREEDLRQPVAGIIPVSYGALPFFFPSPLPVMIEHPMPSNNSPWNGGNAGGSSFGGGGFGGGSFGGGGFGGGGGSSGGGGF